MAKTKSSENKNQAQRQAGTQAPAAAISQTWLNRFSKEDRICFIGLLLLIFIVVVIRSKFLNIPYERDEGAYSYYGKLLLEGKTPYKDFYEQKLPGIFYFFAIMVSIFGSSVTQMHTGFIFLNVASILLIFLAARKLYSAIPALAGATTFAFVSLTANLSGFTIQAEHGVAFFTALGIFLYVMAREKQKWLWYFAMGLSMGAAFMVKTTGLFMMFWGGLILVIDFLFTREKKLATFLRPVLAYCGGALLVVGGLLLAVYVKGSMDQMIFWVYEIPKYYVNRIPFDEGVKYFGYSRDAIVQNHKFFWVLGLLALPLCLLKNVSWRKKLFIVTLGGLSFLTIVPGYYFYGHYWIQLIPGLAILAAFTAHGLITLAQSKLKTAPQRAGNVYLGIFVFLSLFHLNKLRSYYFNPNYEIILRSVYGNNPFPETMEIAGYLNNIMKPEDELAVFGSEPELFIYTNKKSPTRHVFFSTIVASVPQHKEWQREFTADIEKAMPKYFVFYRHSVSLLVQADTDRHVFEWADKFIAQHYKVIGVVEMPDGALHSTYAWGKDAETFQPKAQNVIFVLERKT